MAVVFKKTGMLTDKPFHYCPGCTHGIIHRLVAEVLEELGIGETAIGVAPVGCAVFAYDYFNCDMMEAAHGRAPAVASGIRRVHPDKIVFQGSEGTPSGVCADLSAFAGQTLDVVFALVPSLDSDGLCILAVVQGVEVEG